MKNLLCFLGFHDWQGYTVLGPKLLRWNVWRFEDVDYRQCRRCLKKVVDK